MQSEYVCLVVQKAPRFGSSLWALVPEDRRTEHELERIGGCDDVIQLYCPAHLDANANVSQSSSSLTTVTLLMPGPSSSPPPKRIRHESTSPKAEIDDDFDLGPEIEVDEDHCTICLQPVADRAVIPACSHEFCFECLMIWSRKNLIRFHCAILIP